MKKLDLISGWWFFLLGVMLFINIFIVIPLSVVFESDIILWTVGFMLLWCVPAIPFIFIGALGMLVKEYRELRDK